MTLYGRWGKAWDWLESRNDSFWWGLKDKGYTIYWWRRFGFWLTRNILQTRGHYRRMVDRQTDRFLKTMLEKREWQEKYEEQSMGIDGWIDDATRAEKFRDKYKEEAERFAEDSKYWMERYTEERGARERLSDELDVERESNVNNVAMATWIEAELREKLKKFDREGPGFWMYCKFMGRREPPEYLKEEIEEWLEGREA